MEQHSYEYEVFDARFKHPANFLISGPSQSGKTEFVCSLLKHSNLFTTRFAYIIWFYGEKNKQIFQLKSHLGKKLEIIEGLPTSLDEYMRANEGPGCLIFDDLMHGVNKHEDISQLFTRGSHHRNLTVIYITQNFYSVGNTRKNLTRNAHYIVVFDNPLDQKIVSCLAQQIMPNNHKTFLSIYQAATKKPYGYLLIDGHQTTKPETRYRTDIFNGYQKIYIP
jgi:hypothetical protein